VAIPRSISTGEEPRQFFQQVRRGFAEFLALPVWITVAYLVPAVAATLFQARPSFVLRRRAEMTRWCCRIGPLIDDFSDCKLSAYAVVSPGTLKELMGSRGLALNAGREE
jgi:hypothetical protein